MRCCQWPRPARGCTPRATSVATQAPSSRRSAALKMSANCGGADLGPPSALPVLGSRGGAKVSHLSSGSLRPTVCVSSLGELRGGRRAVAHLIPLPLFGTPSFGVDRQGRGGGVLSQNLFCRTGVSHVALGGRSGLSIEVRRVQAGGLAGRRDGAEALPARTPDQEDPTARVIESERGSRGGRARGGKTSFRA